MEKRKANTLPPAARIALLFLIGILMFSSEKCTVRAAKPQAAAEPQIAADQQAPAAPQAAAGPQAAAAPGQEAPAAAEKMVPYTGDVPHLFFHSLIVDTDRAFVGDFISNGYNYWMTTVKEFQAMLEEMYRRGYVLINIHELAQLQEEENGDVVFVRADPLVPEGKIPFILSIDDVNYYDYMKGDGFADRLMLNEKGEVKNVYIDAEGNSWIGNFDVIPLLDAFVEKHPDFSMRGAKGIVAVTGYEGAFGYRTNEKDAPEYETNAESVRQIAARLRETGWEIASHSYGHRHFPKMSYEEVVRDTNRWKEEVESLVGETDIFIYPYGEELKYDSAEIAYMKESGLRFFCGVWGTKNFEVVKKSYVRSTRRNMDGMTLLRYPERTAEFFDAASVADPSRPPLK